jgi:DNA-binding NarL/FixJ family response regulator
MSEVCKVMCKTLIIEDDTTFRHLLRHMLGNQFPAMAIEEAANGTEAMKKVDHFLPDLIFMDIKLPDESGLDLTKKIKSLYPRIVIIVFTNYDEPEYRDAALRYGATHFIIKSTWSSEQIAKLVESIVSKRKNSGN